MRTFRASTFARSASSSSSPAVSGSATWRLNRRSIERGDDLEPLIRVLEAGSLRRDAMKLLEDWRGLLGRHVSTTRQLLRKLLDRQRAGNACPD